MPKSASQLNREIASFLAKSKLPSHAKMKWVREGSSGRSGAVHTIGQELFLIPPGADINDAVAWIKIVADHSGIRPVHIAYVPDERPGRGHLGRVIVEGTNTTGDGEPGFKSLPAAKAAIKTALEKPTSHATMQRSPYGHELFKTSSEKPDPQIIARRKTADGKIVQLWNDGTLTWALHNAIKGSPHPRTDDQIREALAAGHLVMGEIELYDADDVPRLIEVARKVAKRGGLPGDVRREFAKDAPLRPHWEVQEADRDGKPLVRVWKLPKMSHPGLAVWDEVRGSGGRGRYQVMQEMKRGSGTYAPTGVQFHDLASLSKYLRETSAV